MRRYVGLLFAATLAGMPCVADAQSSFPAPLPDLRTAFLLRLFAEVSDGRASFAASNGDAGGESPFRAAAFSVNPEPAVKSLERFEIGDDDALLRVATVRVTSPSYGAQRGTHSQARLSSRLSPGRVISAYETGLPALFGGAHASAFSFMSGPSDTIPAFVAQSALGSPDTVGSQLAQSLQVPLTLRLGNVQLLAGFNAAQASLPSAGLENTIPVFIPEYAGVNRSDLGANLAVPVTSRLLFGVGYNTEHLVTGYGTPTDLDGLDARNDTYSGNLTFLFPRLSSAVSFSAQQYRYQDNLVPAEFTQLRENVNLTVKF